MNKGPLVSGFHASVNTDYPQESEEGACTRTGGDQEDTECTACHRTIHGSHRPEVGRRYPSRQTCLLICLKHRNRTIIHRIQLCRPHPFHS